ncbi:MAG: acetylornithine deacetylase, partial [Actinobacteria bacterium]|nr:acetylornithine deacetylase [Actinomycetota bacterium]
MDVAALLADLVAIDSVNPALVAGAGGETEIAGYVEAWMRAHGMEAIVLDEPAGRPSVVGIARGTGGGASLMLNGHIDTV